MKKSPFKLDERNMYVIKQVFTIMYILNVLSLIFIVNYREFVLEQQTKEFYDIANVLVFNVVVGIAAILYLGGITFPRIKLTTAFLFYFLIVILGTAFTLIKYGVFNEIPLTFEFVLNKVFIILTISAILVGIFLLFAYLGKRKIEKDLD